MQVVFGYFSLQLSRTRHLIISKICGTPGFTKKNVFRMIFKNNLNKEWLASAILNPSFRRSVRFLGIFHCYRPECAIWLFPKIAGLQDSQKMFIFFKMASHQNHPKFKKRSSAKVWFFVAVFVYFSLFFIAMAQNVPSDYSPKWGVCQWLARPGTQDSDKNCFFEGFSKKM